MKHLRAGVLLAVAVGALAAVAAAAPGRVLRATTPVEALAADGANVAVATQFAPGQCERMLAWNPVRASLRSVGPTVPCPMTSTGRSIPYQAIAGTRAAWVADAGGNAHDSQLFVASMAKPTKTKRLAFTTRDVDSGAGTYAGDLYGANSLLVYATWSVCDENQPSIKVCPVAVTPETIYNARLWRIDGTSGKQTLLTSVTDELAPLSVSAGRILVQRGDGSLEIRRANGQVVQSLPFPPGDVLQAVLGPSDLIVAFRNLSSGQPPKPRLELRDYDPVTGSLKRTLPTPMQAPLMAPRCAYPIGSSPASCRLPVPRFRLVDADATRLVYVLDTTVHVVTLATGAEKTVTAAGKGPVSAQLVGGGLVYSYEVPNRLKGRVEYVPKL